jgi:hypothetical protein
MICSFANNHALGATIADQSALWSARGEPERWRAAPLPGEANHDVFVKLLGLPEKTFRSFLARGIIGWATGRIFPDWQI